jgi:cellulose synthase/poly-beta-1,6-N-acetylglucosamine synthase-like glycosyltransferase
MDSLQLLTVASQTARVARTVIEYAVAGSLAPGLAEISILTVAGVRPRLLRREHTCSELTLTVVVPAHNEEQLIGRCLKSITVSAETARRAVSILVVADNCSDATATVAAAAGAEVLVRHDPEHRGKGYALAFGFEHILKTGSDVALIVDADCVVSDNFIREAAACFASGVEAVQARYEVPESISSARLRLMRVALLGFNVIRPRGRHALGLSAGIFGTGFGLTTHLLREVPYSSHSIVEDLEFHLDLVRRGVTVKFLDSAAVYGDFPSEGSGVKTQRSRWEGGRLRLAQQKGLALLREAVSGKWRLFEPLLDLFTLPLAIQVAGLILLAAIGTHSFQMLAAVGFAILMFHVLVAAFAGGNPLDNLRALASVPFYVIWKIAMTPSILAASSSKFSWVRTARTNQ